MSAAGHNKQTRLAVGVMSGTSLDGIDSALVRIEGSGLGMRATLVRHISRGLDDTRARLRQAAEQKPMTAGEFAQLAWDFGQLHAQLIAELIQSDGPDLICIHGQTVFHQPPISWQLANPAPIAARFFCPVVFDVRQADLARGGQGAPVTPIADWILFREARRIRVIVNLGGFCNITILRPDLNDVRGFDVCACNQVLDAVARLALQKPFDEHGESALRGRATPQAAETLFRILARQRSAGRALGTGDEALEWVKDHAGSLAPDDLASSAVDAIARCIAEVVREHRADEAIIAGGGARNRALINALTSHAPRPIHLSDAFGVPLEAREAIAFAILGCLCADRVPITLPHVTGCRPPAPLAGSWVLPEREFGF